MRYFLRFARAFSPDGPGFESPGAQQSFRVVRRLLEFACDTRRRIETFGAAEIGEREVRFLVLDCVRIDAEGQGGARVTELVGHPADAFAGVQITAAEKTKLETGLVLRRGRLRTMWRR